jgi:tetratricopeptide (TPR) repeat protein
LGLADAILGQAIEMSKQNATAENVSQYLAAAVNAAKKATDIAPKNVATWEFLSNMYINARLVTTEASAWALSSLGKAVELEGNNPLFYISSGNIKLMDKRYSEAKEDFEKALSLKSDLLVGYLRLAVLSETQNNLNGAVAAMEKGLSYGGANNAEYLVNLGRYYFNRAAKNDYSMAELAFKKAISLNANYSDALYALAYLYEREGLASQALELYKRVLELNPGNKDLINKVGNLNSAPPPAEKSDASLPSSPNKKK